MNHFSKLIAFTATCLLASCSQTKNQRHGSASHKKGQRPTPENLFKKLDTNNNGLLSATEFQARPSKGKKTSPEMLQKRFAILDSNSDGQISLTELNAQSFRKKTR